MNLLPARAKGNGLLDCALPVLGSLVPEAEKRANPFAPVDKAAFIGVRPEYLTVLTDGTKGDFQADVDLVEPLGQTTNVYLKMGDLRLIAVMDRTLAKAGQRVGVKVRPDALRLVAA
jgi:multiple sugar transport system ATP-binding protein